MLFHKHRGTATLTVAVPGAGKLVLAGTGIRRQSKRARRAGNVKLEVKPAARAARKLKNAGKVKVRPRLTFSPTGGQPRTRTLRLVLKLEGR